MDKALSNEDVEKIVGHKIGLVTYDMIKNIYDVNEMFVNDCCLIYYPVTPTFGHWCCLRKNNNLINFFDSYGDCVDDELEIIHSKFKPDLLHLLQKYCDKGGKVDYNYHKLQKLSDKISTCGRWCGLFMRYNDMSIDEFANFFKRKQRLGYSPDELCVKISNKFLY